MQKYFNMLIGYPGVGKSTWIKNNAVNITDPPVILSTDALIEEYAAKHHTTYDVVFKEYINIATDIFHDNLIGAIHDEKSIVIDRTNLTKKTRARLLSRVPKTYKKQAIVFYCSKDTQTKRLGQRAGKHISSFIIDAMVGNYQQPSYDEGFEDIIYISTEGKSID